MPLWTIFPFVILLLGIALLPLTVPHFWESNRNRACVVAILTLPVGVWLLRNQQDALFHSLHEYFSFIIFLGTLYVISGGIALTGDLRGTPLINLAFLAIGAVLANLIGTTGASMVLIRAFLKTNSERHNTKHLPVFFIFIVSNCGGLLTPIGDPPLFLGYLQGVPFFWTLKLWPIWLTVNGLLLTIFYLWDTRAFKSETKADLRLDALNIEPLKIKGKRNFLILGLVIGTVFLPSPWREGGMIALTSLSLLLGPQIARKQNQFNWAPIVEVAILFVGIFVTMVPALHFLKDNSHHFSLHTPAHFFWITGFLSSFLDNAPTYLTFLSLAQGLKLSPEILGVPADILKAISIGAVFMGANTYIGNGPNFMVRAIAEQAGYKTPSFFGYIVYALCILLPIYGLVHWLFL